LKKFFLTAQNSKILCKDRKELTYNIMPLSTLPAAPTFRQAADKSWGRGKRRKSIMK